MKLKAELYCFNCYPQTTALCPHGNSMLLPGWAPSGPLLSNVPPDERERLASSALSEHREPRLENAASACCPGLSFLLSTRYALRGGLHIVAQRADLGDKQQKLKNCMILPVISKGNRKEASQAMTSPSAVLFCRQEITSNANLFVTCLCLHQPYGY